MHTINMYQSVLISILVIITRPLVINSDDLDFDERYEIARKECFREVGITIELNEKNIEYVEHLPKSLCVYKCTQDKLNLRVHSKTVNTRNLTTKLSDYIKSGLDYCFNAYIERPPCEHALILHRCLVNVVLSKTLYYLKRCSIVLRIKLDERWLRAISLKHVVYHMIDHDQYACLLRCLAIKTGLINTNNEIIINTNDRASVIPLDQNIILDDVSKMCHDTNVQLDECIRVSRRIECMINNLIDQTYYEKNIP